MEKAYRTKSRSNYGIDLAGRRQSVCPPVVSLAGVVAGVGHATGTKNREERRKARVEMRGRLAVDAIIMSRLMFRSCVFLDTL